jgi:large subunit ribosomal protein L25
MLKLTAAERNIFGKKLATARLAGQLPVIMYGDKKAAQPLLVSLKEFKKVLAEAGESSLVTIEVGEKSTDVLIHEVVFNPVSDDPIHADFYIVDKTKKVEIDVPLHFEGVSPAVKDLGGILLKVLHELKVEVLPTDIPHNIVVDISTLVALDSQILVKDLPVSPKIEVKNAPEEVVAAISVAKEEPVEEVAPVDLSAIEVEKKGKKEEAGAEGEVVAPEKSEKKEEKK